MKVGIPTEIKTDEYRVAITPSGVRELTDKGHEVLVQSGAGEGSTITDEQYGAQGAQILPDAESVFGEAELILGVKEPQPSEVEMLRSDHLLFTYLHLAPDPELTRGLADSGATCVAYETVVDERGRLPASALAAGRRCAAALLRQRAVSAGGRRGRVRRRADPLAGGFHRAERSVGAGSARALLP